MQAISENQPNTAGDLANCTMPQITEVEPLCNHRWLIPDKIMGGGKPSRPGHCEFILQNGITFVLSLDPIPESVQSFFKQHNIKNVQFDILDETDFIDPVPFESAISAAKDAYLNGEKVLVHCGAGLNRSGMVLYKLGQELAAK